ncbi:uncharacterized protein LOC111829962 [Capsella rubella]|uniref:uncharacterized protein LOC111829962 n=1 Tax=Capsella rubella TaxID=81985 RepID=UPI000CD52D9B|nr:uncharacterized protein LOC111829962 [Capsella rubella]
MLLLIFSTLPQILFSTLSMLESRSGPCFHLPAGSTPPAACGFHTLYLKSTFASQVSYQRENAPPTKCSTWLRQARSSALTPETGEFTATEATDLPSFLTDLIACVLTMEDSIPAAHSSSLSSMVRLDCVPENLIPDLPQLLVVKRGSKSQTLVLTSTTVGLSPEVLFPLFSPLTKLPKAMKTLADFSPSLLRPSSALICNLASSLIKLVSFTENRVYSSRISMMELAWTCLSLSRYLADSLNLFGSDTSLILKQCRALQVLSTLPVLVPYVSVLTGRRHHDSRAKDFLGWLDSYSCQGQIENCYRNPPSPFYHQSSKGLKLGSCLIFLCLNGYKLCVESLNLHGQVLHVREDPPALLQFCKYHSRTLVVASSSVLRMDPKRLKVSDLLLLYLLMPARNPTWPSSSTSLCLMTVTSLSSFASLIDDHSTNRDLTCDIMLHRLCFKVLMDSLSFYRIYLILFFENVSFSYLLSFVIFESLIVLG